MIVHMFRFRSDPLGITRPIRTISARTEGSRRLRTICGMANPPRMTGIGLIPWSRSAIPNVNLAWFVMGSSPTIAMRSPRIPAIHPLTGVSGEVSDPQMRTPNVARRKYSTEVKPRATSSRSGMTRSMASRPIAVPIVEATVAVAIALPARPWRRSPSPSSAVAAAAAVPGMFSRRAGWHPP